MVALRYGDIKPNSPYGRMVRSAFREQAAMIIQRAWRTQKGSSFQHVGYEQLLQVDSLAFLQEPNDTVLADKIVVYVKKREWKQLLSHCLWQPPSSFGDNHNDVTRSLFQAFRMGRLTEDDFLSAKQIIDAMRAWRPNETDIETHALNDTNSPYDVRAAFPGPFDEQEIDVKYEYTTIRWPMGRVAAFLLSCLDLQDKYQRALVAPIYYKILEQYKQYFYGKKVSDSDLMRSLKEKISGRIGVAEQADVYFLAGILSGFATCPIIAMVPARDSAHCFSVYSVLMPMQTMRYVLEKINDGDCVYPRPILGPISTRHIRAVLERGSDGGHDSDLDHLLCGLYPSNERMSARPLPVQHPDCVVMNLKPHGYACSPHLMWLHDVYHLFKCNHNECLFELMRYLRLYLSFRGERTCLMNKSLWALVDMEFLFGMRCRSSALGASFYYKSHFISGILMMHHCQIFDMDVESQNSRAHFSEKNIHVMVDIIRNACVWTRMMQLDQCITEYLCGEPCDFSKEAMGERRAALIFHGMRDVYGVVVSVFDDYPDAGHTELFVRHWMGMVDEHTHVDTLLFYAAWLAWDDVFEWSSNGSVFFRRSVFDSQQRHGGLLEGCKRKLVVNKQSDVVKFIHNLAFDSFYQSSQSLCPYVSGSTSVVDCAWVCLMLSTLFTLIPFLVQLNIRKPVDGSAGCAAIITLQVRQSLSINLQDIPQ